MTDQHKTDQTDAPALRKSVAGMLALLISTLLVVLLLYRYDLRIVVSILRESGSWKLFGAAGLVIVSHMLFGAARWRQILSGMNIPIPFSEALLIRMGCSPVKLLVPLKGGELFKALYLTKHHDVSFVTGVSSLLFDKMSVLFAMVPFLLAAAILSGEPLPIAGALAVAIATVLLFFTPARNGLLQVSGLFGKTLRGFMEKLLSAFEQVPARRALVAVTYSVILYGVELLLYFTAFQATGVEGAFSRIFSAVVIAQVAGVLPIFVSGIGGREATLVYLLAGDGSGAAVLAGSLLFSLLGRVAVHLAGLFWLPRFLSGLLPSRHSEPAGD